MMGVVLKLLLLSTCLIKMTSSIDPCERHERCSECVRDSALCSWCASENFDNTRCKSMIFNTENWCPEPLQNTQNNITVSEKLDFNSKQGQVIQVKPQKFKMLLRPGAPADFKISFKTAIDYPIDLYFILDASATMHSIRTEIEKQSFKIYKTMQNLTKNIQLGIGTFVDKNTLPFTNQLDSSKTYSFKHRLNLTDDIQIFKKIVNEFRFGSNYDPIEGGFDALAQVISCKEKLGWKDESRKIIVILSDAPAFHSAGDGLIAGIYKPYDGGCYLNDDGTYANELEMDYPSVSIINKMAAEQEMTIIFVVKSEYQNYYSRLSESIGGSKYVSYDSNKITSVLEKLYEEIKKPIKLKVSYKSGQRDNFHVTFDPDCVSGNTDCDVMNGREKHFNGTIKLLNYFGVDQTSIEITIEGIKEKIVLDVEIIEDCDCAGRGKVNADECSKAGTLQCGICICDAKSYGEKCACTANAYSSMNNNSTCIAPDDVELCSGHGSCICGRCNCRKDSPYEGTFCQYNKGLCPKVNKLVCNGHGSCEGEKCVCVDGWSGNACECPGTNEQCVAPNGKVCSGFGQCKCEKCVCSATASWDARVNVDSLCHIQPCPDCHRPQCNLLENCARCLHSGEGQCPSCAGIKTNVTHSALDPTWSLCPDIRVDVGCYTRFMYRYHDSEYGIEISVQADKNCLESYYMYGGICLASLILIGVATLVGWKWLTDARDRQEYEKWRKDHEDDLTEPCDNPTYKPASTTTNNPAFRKPSVDHNVG